MTHVTGAPPRGGFWQSTAGHSITDVGVGVSAAVVVGAITKLRHATWGHSAAVAGLTGAVAGLVAVLAGCGAAGRSAPPPHYAINGSLSGNAKSFGVSGSRDAQAGWTLTMSRPFWMNVDIQGKGTDARPGTIVASNRYTHSWVQFDPGPTIDGHASGVLSGDFYYDSKDYLGQRHRRSKANEGMVDLTGTDQKWQAHVNVPHQWDVTFDGTSGAKGWTMQVHRHGFGYSASGTGPMTRQQGLALALGIESDTADFTSNL
jgi:hypothetical protein